LVALASNGAADDRAITRNPKIFLVSPSAAVTGSLIHFEIKFLAFNGAQIDPKLVKITYLKQSQIDLTPRVATFILTAAISNMTANSAKDVVAARTSDSNFGTTIPTRPTHVVITSAPIEVFEAIAADGTKGPTVQRLGIGTSVFVMKSANGWDLVARDGKSLGYVAHSGLAPLQ
jgi:hypothetical protein